VPKEYQSVRVYDYSYRPHWNKQATNVLIMSAMLQSKTDTIV